MICGRGVTLEDMYCLLPGVFLSDSVSHAFFDWLQQRVDAKKRFPNALVLPNQLLDQYAPDMSSGYTSLPTDREGLYH